VCLAVFAALFDVDPAAIAIFSLLVDLDDRRGLNGTLLPTPSPPSPLPPPKPTLLSREDSIPRADVVTGGFPYPSLMEFKFDELPPVVRGFILEEADADVPSSCIASF